MQFGSSGLMLLLNRKPGEAITLQIGDIAVRVLVLDIREGRVNLGIEAPASVKIMREELVTANQEDGRQSQA